MNGFSVLMFIFSGLVILAGFYIYKGHNSELLIWKGYNPKATKSQLKEIGKWTIITGVFILIIGLIGLLFNI